MNRFIAYMLFLIPTVSVAAEPIGPSTTEWEQVVDRAITFLKQSQDENGAGAAIGIRELPALP